MGIKDKDFLEMLQRSRAFEERLLGHHLHKDAKIETMCHMYHEKLTVNNDAPTAIHLRSIPSTKSFSLYSHEE